MKIHFTHTVVPALFLLMINTSAFAEAANSSVDCSTAQDDIATLEADKKPTSDKAVDGALGYTPIGLIANVATGGDKMEESEKLNAEEYNKRIDVKINEIKTQCGNETTNSQTSE